MKLFVFGTLMLGQGADYLMKGMGGHKLCDVSISHFRMYNLGFPAIKYDPESPYVVKGELWDVHPDQVKGPIDSYEGVPSLFRRIKLDFDRHNASGSLFEHVKEDEPVWMYEYCGNPKQEYKPSGTSNVLYYPDMKRG